MRFSRLRWQPFPTPLRWLLALALVLNGAAVPRVMAHTAMLGDHAVAEQAIANHAAASHCHPSDAAASKSAQDQQHPCPCCAAGAACPCGCVTGLALPMTFPDLRPLAPATPSDRLRLAEFAAAPRHRLLRPPIA